MDYEILFWFEDVACAFRQIAFFVALLACAGCGITTAAYTLVKHNSLCSRDRDREAYAAGASLVAPWPKRFLVAACIFVLLALASEPFSHFTDIYKKILIYRGVNSTLADKSVDTAEKALDLLNLKLDESLGQFKTEKEE